MKKVLLIASEFPPLPGGIGTHAFHLATQLTAKGFCIVVLTNQRNLDVGIEEDFDRQQSFRVIRSLRKSFGLTYFERMKQVFQIIKQEKPTLIIASGKFSLWMGALVVWCFKTIRGIAVIHGTEIKAGGYFSQQFTKVSLQKFKTLIAVSHFTKEKIFEVVPTAVIRVINNGINLPESVITNVTKSSGLHLVTVGNLTRRKGQHNVINALPELLLWNPAIHYHCIGLPSEQLSLQRLAESLGVQKYITFHGVLSGDELRNQLQKSHVFLMLSEHLNNGDFEGFGIAVLEANIIGIPAIGSRDSGIADAIKENYSGKLVDPQDPKAIKAALIEIMGHYETYATQAQEWATHFQWKDIIENYCQVLEL